MTSDLTSATDAFSPEEIATGERAFRRPWTFVLGVAELGQLPEPDQPEIAFAGRSNVGKSSLINAVVGTHGLARTSNTPGRTQQLNIFTCDLGVRLVDLPGYGFAKAPKELVDRWTKLVRRYLRGRPSLARVYLLVDARHGLKPVDRELMALLGEAAVSYQVVLTKADKVKPPALAAVLEATTRALATEPAAYPQVLATSAETKAGIPGLRAAITRLLAERGIRLPD